jgi:hypothetical protein
VAPLLDGVSLTQAQLSALELGRTHLTIDVLVVFDDHAERPACRPRQSDDEGSGASVGSDGVRVAVAECGVRL